MKMQPNRQPPPPEQQRALVRSPRFGSQQNMQMYFNFSKLAGMPVVTRCVGRHCPRRHGFQAPPRRAPCLRSRIRPRRTTARQLGLIADMWVDPARNEVVGLSLLDKKGVLTPGTRVGNVPLSAMLQIGDVVLVHDEAAVQSTVDSRFGYTTLIGAEVRTPSGRVIGKVRMAVLAVARAHSTASLPADGCTYPLCWALRRCATLFLCAQVRDFVFSPDRGSLTSIIYDDFGLSFLPVNFFDLYAFAMGDILSISREAVIVRDEAREADVSRGIFWMMPRLLGSDKQPALLASTTSASRSGAAGLLPSGYSQSDWEAEKAAWEQATGMTYEQYTAMYGSGRYGGAQAAQVQQQAQYRQRGVAAASSSSSSPPGGWQQQQQQPGMDPRYRGAPGPAGPDPRQRSPAPQQGSWAGYAAQPAAQPQQQAGSSRWPGPSAAPSAAPRPAARPPPAAAPSAPSGSGRPRVEEWIDRNQPSRPRMEEVLEGGDMMLPAANERRQAPPSMQQQQPDQRRQQPAAGGASTPESTTS